MIAQGELSLFASHFHQDFELLFSDVNAGAAEYLKTLSGERKTKLRQDLESMLVEYSGKDEVGLRKAWRRAGAQFWPRERELRPTLEAWVASLR